VRTRSSFLPGTAWPERLQQACVAGANWLWRCAESSAQRRALAELDDDRLRDIGRTRAEAQAEAAKPFWRR
jgi:uncharacterized protein YjiS (DUF1127 family)